MKANRQVGKDHCQLTKESVSTQKGGTKSHVHEFSKRGGVREEREKTGEGDRLFQTRQTFEFQRLNWETKRVWFRLCATICATSRGVLAII